MIEEFPGHDDQLGGADVPNFPHCLNKLETVLSDATDPAALDMAWQEIIECLNKQDQPIDQLNQQRLVRLVKAYLDNGHGTPGVLLSWVMAVTPETFVNRDVHAAVMVLLTNKEA